MTHPRRRPRTGRLVAGLVTASLATLALTATAASGTPRSAASVPTGDGVWSAAGVAAAGSSEADCQWAMYGQNLARTFSHECETAISTTSVATLVPAWFFQTGFSVTASPAVVGGQVFVGDWSGTMHALDAGDGTELWSVQTEEAPGAPFGPIVSSAAVADVVMGGEAGARRLVIFGSGPRMYALDATDGSEVWVQYFGADIVDEQIEFESSPVVHDGVVYIGMDVHNRTLDQTGGVRGGVFALDAATGETLWYFNPEWDDERSGCSSVWSSPTLNVGAGLVYGATGNCPHDVDEWTPYIESIFALDMATGDPVWSYTPSPLNHDDYDFGATANLFRDAGGRQVVGIGKKDGNYYALDPLTGELFWTTNVQTPFRPQDDFSVGGFIGSTAIWDGNVFGGTAIGSPPYYHSLEARTGAVRPWAGVAGPAYGASAAAGGVVFAANLDNTIKAFDPATGAILWTSELSGPSSSGPAIVGDSLYVGAGTSASDLCAKDTPVFSDLCFALFDDVLGSLGGVHAYRLATSSDDGSPPPSATDPEPEPEPGTEVQPGSQDAPAPDADPSDAPLPATGGSLAAASLLLAAAVRLRRH